jgi:hypothetical protein
MPKRIAIIALFHASFIFSLMVLADDAKLGAAQAVSKFAGDVTQPPAECKTFSGEEKRSITESIELIGAP